MMQIIKKLFILFTAIIIGGASNAQNQIVVAQDGSGNFTTIQDAINSLPAADNNTQRIIRIKKGTYKEKLFIDKKNGIQTFCNDKFRG